MPVILLSARAGEEARVEGLGAGADDYLVKPFAARELLARVASHLAAGAAAPRGRRRGCSESEARLQAAVDLVGLSPYSWDPATGALEWDDRLRAIWGLPPGAPVDMDVFLAGIHPDDRPLVEAAIAACTDPAGNGVYHARIPRGRDRRRRGAVGIDARPHLLRGRPSRLLRRRRARGHRTQAGGGGLRESEARFREFAEHSASVLWVTDLKGLRIEYLSPAFEAVWGRPPGTMPQRLELWTESIHPDDRAHALAAMERVRRGEAAVARIPHPAPGGRRALDPGHALPDPRRAGPDLAARRDSAGHHRARRHPRLCRGRGRGTARQRLSLLLGRAGYEVQPFDAARAFLDAAPALVPGCVVLDFATSGAMGPLVVRELKARRIGLPVVAVGESRGDVGPPCRR